MSDKKVSRRYFIMVGAAAIGAGCQTGKPKSAAAAKGSKGPRKMSPNDKVNVAGIGAGGKGRTDISECAQAGANIVALCDPDERQAGEMRAQYPNAKFYTDYREMIEKHPDIDAVTVSTPDHSHYPASLLAIKNGKHVYCQKPLTHTVEEARNLAKAAKEYKVVTQMGNQGHAGNGVRELCEMIWSGVIGQIKECHIWTNRPIWPQGLNRPDVKDTPPKELNWDLWLGPAKKRPFVDKHPVTNKACYCPFVWRGWWDFGCGALGDMACHIADPPNWALRLSTVNPTSIEVVSQEGMTSEQAPNKAVLKYQFPARGKQNPVTVYWYDGGNFPPRPAGIPADVKIAEGSNGSLFIGESGAICADTYGENPRLLPYSLMDSYKKPDATIPRVPGENPYSEWISAIQNNTLPGSNFSYAGPFTEWILLGNLALRSGKSLQWDGANLKVTNVPEANEWVRKDYRSGWNF
jgi:predicted dehydrogenase